MKGDTSGDLETLLVELSKVTEMTHIKSKKFKATQIYIRISYLNSEFLTLIGPKR